MDNLKYSRIKVCFSHFILSMIAVQTFAHSQFIISGRILNYRTNDPIEVANVYLSKTTFGTTSDKEGKFYLKNIPPGKYHLIISVMGYAVEKREIRVEGPGILNLEIKLTEQVIVLPGITVTGKDQRQRKKYLKKFNRAFLGTTNNSLETKILNEDILIFKRKKNKLLTYANAPLIIENRGLGYKIEYVLEYFELDPNYVKYAGDIKFEELTPVDPEEARYWASNREIAYRGSLQHFLTILCHTYDLKKDRENFTDKDDIHKIASKTFEKNYLSSEGFNIYLINNLFNLKTFKEDRLKNPHLLLGPSTRQTEMLLKFNNYLKVEFFRDKEEASFLRDKGMFRHPGPQVSWISLISDSVIIDRHGRYHDPMFKLQKGGYMAWERMAEMMPADYEPPKR